MDFKNDIIYARALDAQDDLQHLRNEFLIPQHNGQDAVYLCGNSLGLQPRAARERLLEQLNVWQQKAVEGWFEGDVPWLEYHKQLKPALAAIVGASQTEITVMNSLTVNLHLLMVSFYKPTSKRYKIIIEGRAFPSDMYAIESQVRYHDFKPDDAIIEIFPRKGEYTLQTADIVKVIEDNADELALVLFGGINYYTGQLFDMEAITNAGHKAGALVGFDLAHAAGNIPLQLHRWDVDFACWCSYKYLNSGPGGISGIFVHDKHFGTDKINRFAGWWGYERSTQFKMDKGFKPEPGADGWQVSTSPVMLMALNKAALDVFALAGGIEPLREKSRRLTAYLEFLINGVNEWHKDEWLKIITPHHPDGRGCQLSIVCKQNGRSIFDYLQANGVMGDWREPDVIRLSPVPLYNTFTDVYRTGRLLYEAVELLSNNS